MPTTKKPKKSTTPKKSRLYLEIEETILLRVVLPLKKSGMTSHEISAALKIGVRQVDRLIQQAEEIAAAKFRPKMPKRQKLYPDGPTWNQRQAQLARDRIQKAVAELRDQGNLGAQTTDRFNQLAQYKISGSTLYKHRDLWDPECV